MAGAPDRVKLDISKVTDEFKFRNFVDLKERLLRLLNGIKNLSKITT